MNNTYNLLIKYYEIHVAHRRQMLNYFIITTGLMLTSVSFTLEKGFINAATGYCILATLICIFFRALDALTYIKIRRSEKLLTKEIRTAKNLFERKNALSDRVITQYITYIILALFQGIFLWIAFWTETPLEENSMDWVRTELNNPRL
ncbi:MAG: hypothetical protein R3E13_03150 [Alphaproteobacteria bacterium]